MTAQAPSASELEAHSVVAQALQQAWSDSFPNDPALRHEEGGWIYLDPTTGKITVQRAPGGGTASIDLSNPPAIFGSMVIGKFHTHPNPASDGWVTGPSRNDRQIDALHGVPDLIRAEDGVHYSGPERRRGGLTGNSGYPA